MRSLRPLLFAWMAAAALLAATARPAAPQELRGGLEEGFFELAVQRLPDRVTLVTLVDSAGHILVPLRTVLEEVGIPVREEGDSLALEWPPAAWNTVLHRAAHTIVLGESRRRIAPELWIVRDGEDYVDTDVLASILQARVDVSFSDLAIMVTENLDLPAIRRMELDARRARELRQAALADPNRYQGVPYVARNGGWAAGWGVSMAEAGGQSRGTVRATVGASVLGGGLEVGGTGAFTEHGPTSMDDRFARYSRVFAGSSLVRRVDVGSVLSQGTLSRRMWGATVTNQPYTTPRYFGDALVTPVVPAGWEYEVYQGEHLVGVSGGDASTQIRTPLNYGNTPVRIRLIGPAGQEREENLVYVVPQGRVPPGAWRYSLGGGRCQDPGCRSYQFGELLHGFAPWLTAGGGVDRLVTESATHVLPFGRVDISPRPWIGAEIQARGTSFFRTSLRYAAGRSGSLSGSYAWTGQDAGALGAVGWAGQAAASGPVGLAGGRWASARLLLRGREQGHVDSWQAGVATTFRRTHVSLDVESGLQGHNVTTVRAYHTLGAELPSALEDASVYGAVGVRPDGFELGEVGVSVRTAQRVLVNAQLRLRQGASPSLSIGVSVRSALGYFQARGSRGTGSGAYVSADGGVAYDPDAGLVTLPYESVGRGGAAGEVFRDLDGDGRRGPGEPAEANVDVMVGGRRVTTDAQGRFRTWDLTPYEGTEVAVDSLSLDPDWAPSEPARLFRPSPNMFTPMELAVHRTREVMGSVVRAGADARPAAGVRVDVVRENGDVVATQRTFSDGVFYFQRVSPGSYTLRVSHPGGDALRVPLDVPASDGPALELAPITLPAGG